MASHKKSSKTAQPNKETSCFKTELGKLIAKCLPILQSYHDANGLEEYDIDQGYQRQPDCDKYWHQKH